MTNEVKPLRPELIPLVDLLARAAYEAILRGEFKEPESLPDDPVAVQKLQTDRPAA